MAYVECGRGEEKEDVQFNSNPNRSLQSILMLLLVVVVLGQVIHGHTVSFQLQLYTTVDFPENRVEQ